MRSPVSFLLAAFLTAGLLSAFRQDINPDTLRKCKRATVLVLVEGHGSGTGFYIGNGLFVTNSHVVEADEGEARPRIRLVLDAAEATQRIITATVVSEDSEVDLALLKSDVAGLPAALELGDSSTLVETQSTIAFGFPFGKVLALDKGGYPAMSVSVGRISAIRKAKGKTETIQLDSSLNPGNSGGPVCNTSGQVIGIVQAGIPGAALNFAIPVNHLRQFLHGSVLILRAPALNRAAQSANSDILIEVTPEILAGRTIVAGLVLSSDAQDTREYIATETAPGRYKISAPLVPASEATMVQISVQEPDNNWGIRVKDHTIRVGGRPLKLSAIKQIEFGLSPSVTLTSGQRVTGAIIGLKDIEAIQNGKPKPIDLSKAQEIQITPADAAVKAVRYEVTLAAGTEVVAQQKGAITANGVEPDIAPKRIVATPSTTTNRPADGGIPLPSDVTCYRFPVNGHYYCFLSLTEDSTWVTASLVARSLRYKGLRGHLATITSAAENAFVSSHPENNTGALGGFQDRSAADYSEPSGGWRWVTGEPWRYANWRGGEPNNADGKEDYLGLHEDGTWNDFGTKIRDIIVEFE